jgi:hypothetical protein
VRDVGSGRSVAQNDRNAHVELSERDRVISSALRSTQSHGWLIAVSDRSAGLITTQSMDTGPKPCGSISCGSRSTLQVTVGEKGDVPVNAPRVLQPDELDLVRPDARPRRTTDRGKAAFDPDRDCGRNRSTAAGTRTEHGALIPHPRATSRTCRGSPATPACSQRYDVTELLALTRALQHGDVINDDPRVLRVTCAGNFSGRHSYRGSLPRQ